MKRFIWLVLVLLALPTYGNAGTKGSALTDASATVAGTDYLLGYILSGPGSRRYTINSILALKTSVSGNAGTATALAANGANCSAGYAPLGVDASGAVESCTQYQTYDADLTTWAGVTPGTGVATALAVNVGSAGAPVVNGGALGTPSSGTLTNCTFPTLNQNTTGSAATLTTSRNIGDAPFNGSAAITLDAIADNEDISPTGGTWNLSALTALTLPSFSTGSSATPTLYIEDSDAPGTDKEIAKLVGAYVDGADGAENGTLDINVHVAGTSTSYIQLDGKNTQVEVIPNLVVTGAVSANNVNPDAADGATLGTTALEWSDLYLAAGGVIYGENDQANTITSSSTGFNFNLPLGLMSANDPDVATEGKISWDANGDVMRGYDGTRQVAVARVQEEIHVTVVKPQDIADAVRDAFPIWSNESGMSFVVTGWKAWAGTDDTTLNIEETDADGQNNATVDAVEIATNGTGLYYASDTSITGATIENGHLIFLDFDDTDDPSYVKLTIYGYYNADVN